MIVVAWPDAPDTVAETVVVPPSSAMLASASVSVTVGVASSSVMVPVPVAVPSPAPRGLLSVILTVSSGSSRASSVTATSRVRLVSAAPNVNVPGVTAV